MIDTKMISAEEIDCMFDEGEDVTPYLRIDTIRFPDKEEAIRKVNSSIPEWVVLEMEREAKHLAVSRSAIMNMWLADKAKERRKERASV